MYVFSVPTYVNKQQKNTQNCVTALMAPGHLCNRCFVDAHRCSAGERYPIIAVDSDASRADLVYTMACITEQKAPKTESVPAHTLEGGHRAWTHTLNSPSTTLASSLLACLDAGCACDSTTAASTLSA